MKTEQDYSNGIGISAMDFCKLCDKYEITIPARTKGFILKHCINIHNSGYSIIGGTFLSKTMAYIDKLNRAIKGF